VEDVVEAVALAEANAAPTQARAVSLAFREGYSAENNDEDDVQQQTRKRHLIQPNRERGNDSSDYLIDSATCRDGHFTVDLEFQKLYFDRFASQQKPQIHFSVPKETRPEVLASVLSKKWRRGYG
jgi:hypothetical protein